MSTLRDARFEKALAHAPDVADVAAPDAVRDAIHQAAHRAVAQTLRAPWWRRLFDTQPRMPWNAAFASLLVVGFVTLLWRGGEQLPQEPGTAALPPVAVPQASRADAGSATSSEPVPAVVPAAPQRAAKPVPAKRDRPAAGPQAPVAPTPAAAAPEAVRPETRDKATGDQRLATEQPDATRSKEATMPAPPSASAAADARAPVMQAAPATVGRAAASPPPAAPALAPAAAPSRRMETSPAANAVRSAGMPAWDTVRVESPPRAAVIPRAEALAFEAALRELLAAPGVAVANARSGSGVQLTLMEGTRTTGQLTLAADAVTWQAAGEPAVTWRPDAARLGALREQSLLLLQR